MALVITFATFEMFDNLDDVHGLTNELSSVVTWGAEDLIDLACIKCSSF